ncbi:exonuclease domain-containing protein [Sphingomonas sp. LB3N6]|uniref:exonuclease domain-containing protein n=1 Tax=Sphingomonas fucosidasi TaxID=3096164 RepID=UPI002FC99606
MSDVTHSPAPQSPAPQNDAPDFVVIDVETACSRVSSICQIGIVGFKNGREIFEYETLVDPRDIFEVFNTRIHGIAEHHVVGQPTFADVHAIVHGHLTSRTTVAHSYFDKGALAAACRVHDRAMIETTWLDSVRVAKRAWPDLESHRLGLLARYLGITHKHHDALSDARAAGWVIVKACEHTGLSLADWLAPPRVAGPAPRAADDGPLKGERVAILGEPRDGKLAHLAAGLGARVMTGVGSSTTLLVVAGREPFGRAVRSSAAFLKAEELRRDGAPLRIVASDALRKMAALRP